MKEVKVMVDTMRLEEF